MRRHERVSAAHDRRYNGKPRASIDPTVGADPGDSNPREKPAGRAVPHGATPDRAFALSSAGRSALTLASILLIREFLAGRLGGAGGLAGAPAAAFGTTAALWCVALLLIGTYMGASALNYYNAVTQQRIVKVIELGLWSGSSATCCICR